MRTTDELLDEICPVLSKLAPQIFRPPFHSFREDAVQQVCLWVMSRAQLRSTLEQADAKFRRVILKRQLLQYLRHVRGVRGSGKDMTKSARGRALERSVSIDAPLKGGDLRLVDVLSDGDDVQPVDDLIHDEELEEAKEAAGAAAREITEHHRRPSTQVIEHDGLSLTVGEWAAKLGITERALRSRLERNPIEVAMRPGPRKPGRPRKIITFNGKSMTINEWAAELGMHVSSLRWRLKQYPLEEALKAKRSAPGCEQREFVIHHDEPPRPAPRGGRLDQLSKTIRRMTPGTWIHVPVGTYPPGRDQRRDTAASSTGERIYTRIQSAREWADKCGLDLDWYHEKSIGHDENHPEVLPGDFLIHCTHAGEARDG